MIELNLLPAVKLDYIKAERSRRMALTIAIIATIVSVGLLVLLLFAELAEKAILHNLNNSVANASQELKQKPNINEILTVQNQLSSLTNLHATKPAANRLFTTYLDEVTPSNVSINNLSIDFNLHTLSISGTADTLKTVNQYVDTLKYTTYTYVGNTTATPAFTDVVLSGFSTGSSGPSTTTKNVTYTVTLDFDPTIFDITKTVTLTVPNITTTRSETAQPGDLFTSSAATTGAQ